VTLGLRGAASQNTPQTTKVTKSLRKRTISYEVPTYSPGKRHGNTPYPSNQANLDGQRDSELDASALAAPSSSDEEDEPVEVPDSQDQLDSSPKSVDGTTDDDNKRAPHAGKRRYSPRKKSKLSKVSTSDSSDVDTLLETDDEADSQHEETDSEEPSEERGNFGKYSRMTGSGHRVNPRLELKLSDRVLV
jgi:hypothetical protein